MIQIVLAEIRMQLRHTPRTLLCLGTAEHCRPNPQPDLGVNNVNPDTKLRNLIVQISRNPD